VGTAATTGTRHALPALGLGAGAGLLSGLFGVGGGALVVPGLTGLLGFSQHAAHATSLAAILLIAPVGLVRLAAGGAVDVGAAGVLSVGAVLGAAAGSRLLPRIPARALRRSFGVFLLLVAARLLLGGDGGGSGEVMAGEATVARVDLDLAGVAGLLVLGVLSGVLSSLLGVGGGVVLVPALALLFASPQVVAQGTSLLVIVPTSLVGAVSHARRGYTRWRIGLGIGAGGAATSLLGAELALRLQGRALALLFGGFLALTAVRTLRSTAGSSGR